RHVSELARTVWRLNKQADMLKLREQKAQIAELQARVAQLEAQLAGRDDAPPSLDGPHREADVLQVD
ncbi:MAG: hypothetical protein M3380_07310, partial [Chloroflexota bacterium]|nr:hypothetical protein [Chloroflexota bacterium]